MKLLCPALQRRANWRLGSVNEGNGQAAPQGRAKMAGLEPFIRARKLSVI